MRDASTTRERIFAEMERAAVRSVGAPIRWGRNDCAIWCANVLKRPLGYDPAKAWRGTYSSERTAHKRLGKMGLPRALERTARIHGWGTVGAAEHAEPGDLALVDTPAGAACMLCYGRGFWIGRTDGGVALVPTTSRRFLKIWRVC